MRVIPECNIGETIVIGRFKGRTRTSTANAEARRALQIIGSDAYIEYVLGAQHQ